MAACLTRLSNHTSLVVGLRGFIRLWTVLLQLTYSPSRHALSPQIWVGSRFSIHPSKTYEMNRRNQRASWSNALSWGCDGVVEKELRTAGDHNIFGAWTLHAISTIELLKDMFSHEHHGTPLNVSLSKVTIQCRRSVRMLTCYTWYSCWSSISASYSNACFYCKSDRLRVSVVGEVFDLQFWFNDVEIYFTLESESSRSHSRLVRIIHWFGCSVPLNGVTELFPLGFYWRTTVPIPRTRLELI